MESEKPLLPLVVPNSSGVGGVSPRVSMLKIAEVSGVRGDTEEFRTASQELSLNCFGQEPGAAKMVYEAFFEAGRANFEQTLQFFQDLSGAKSPNDAFSIHIDYMNRQMQFFSHQTQIFGGLFTNLLGSAANALETRVPVKRIQ